MASITDDEFGTISVRRSSRATAVTIKVAPNGSLVASLPLYAPLFLLRRLVKSSRAELQAMLREAAPAYHFTSGMAIGKSHTLVVMSSRTGQPLVERQRTQIIVYLPDDTELNSPEVIDLIRPVMQAALRIEAKSYLPGRLKYLAAQLGCHYDRVRFSHASGRWGSCSSNGTISLNIALMKLPHELIDYVIVHELSHTKQMNHSTAFWQLVSIGDPLYKLHRASLKTHAPTI